MKNANAKPGSRSKSSLGMVGYCRPPKHSQFKPGKSGNPSGKRKGTRSFSSLLTEELQTPINVSLGGRARSITLLEAIIKQVTKAAVSGDDKARKLVLSLIMALEERGSLLEPDDEFTPKENIEIFEGFLKRWGISSSPGQSKTRSKSKGRNAT